LSYCTRAQTTLARAECSDCVVILYRCTNHTRTRWVVAAGRL